MKLIRRREQEEDEFPCRLVRTEITGRNPVRVFAVESAMFPDLRGASCQLEVEGTLFSVKAIYPGVQSRYYRIVASMAC